MSLNREDRDYLRDLAYKVKEISQNAVNESNRQEWYRHNSLKKGKPLILVFPEGSWEEILPYSDMRISDGFWRDYEWHLRHVIYRWEKIRDDSVVEPVIKVPLEYTYKGWGLESEKIDSGLHKGAAKYLPAIREYEDISKLKKPEFIIDANKSLENYERVRELFDGILEVKPDRIPKSVNVDYIKYATVYDTSLIGTLARLRGIEQLMMDMHDNPDWVHSAMQFMTSAAEELILEAEENGWLELNNGNDYVGSGGLGYTTELPQEDFINAGGKVRLCDMWGFAEAQDLTMVSPAMLDEFVIPYQSRLLKHFGLNCYGCCEKLDNKFNVIKKIPNLRRISVSPWTDEYQAACELEDKYIYSWKPNPSWLAVDLDIPFIKEQMQKVFNYIKDCIVEIVLKDTHTVQYCGERFQKWVETCRSVFQ